MSRLHALARAVMTTAAFIAPPVRADWRRAMQGEFAAIDDGKRALGWSAGCLATAVGWRLRTDGVWLAIVIFVALKIDTVASFFFFGLLDTSIEPMTQINIMHWIRNGLFALTGLILALYRPDRALLSALAVPLLPLTDPFLRSLFVGPMIESLMRDPFSSLGNEPQLPNWLFSLHFFYGLLWPAVIGAAIGWGVRRITDARRRVVV